MGTHWNVNVSGHTSLELAEIKNLVLQALDTVVLQMSPWEANSDLRKFHAGNPQEWIAFRPEAFRVLQRALEIAKETDGLYDPTFAHAIDLLGFGPSESPGAAYNSPSVQQAMTAAGFGQIKTDTQARSVLQPGNLGLDLCSIAKGFAVDLIFESLVFAGQKNFTIEIGGEARGLGCKPSGAPWLFALDRPRDLQIRQRLPETRIALCNIALATSGNYLRYHIVDGQPIGHLINPKATNEKTPLLSVSVMSQNCMDADAYATALFLMGKEQGLIFARKRNLAAVFLDHTGEEFSPAAETMLN